jgi:hypothetical protein
MNAPAKIIAKSKISEWQGLDRISLVVHGMGCIWREQEKDDVGIDGEIELCRPRDDGQGSIATGNIVKVQSKSGSKYVVRDNDSGFASPVTEKDLTYWRTSNLPIIYIVYHPDDDCLYWKDIKAYLSDRPDALKPPLRIEFDKTADRFDKSAYPALCALCAQAPERVSTEVGEVLYTNLLEIVQLPQSVWITPVLPQKQPRFHDRLTGNIPPYVYGSGTLVTLTDPTEGDTVLRSVIDAGGIEKYSLDDWLGSRLERADDLRRLLNGLMHRHLRGLGLDYQKKPRRYFYRRGLAEDSPLTRRWTSARTGRSQTRTVAKYYTFGKLKFYRHQALDFRSDRFSLRWAFALDPHIHFTLDGVKPWEGDAAKSYAIRARAEQYNDAYLNNIFFWAHQLSRGEPSFPLMIGEIEVARVNGIPAIAHAPFSIQSMPTAQKNR